MRFLEEQVDGFDASSNPYEELSSIKKNHNSFLDRLKLMRLGKLEWLGLTLATVIPAHLSNHWAKSIDPKYHLHNILPRAVPVGQLVMSPALVLNSLLECIHPSSALLLGAPIVEEYMARHVLQDLTLTKLPKKILKKYNIDPAYTDKLPARIARILITSYLFAVGHKPPSFLPTGKISKDQLNGGFYPHPGSMMKCIFKGTQIQ